MSNIDVFTNKVSEVHDNQLKRNMTLTYNLFMALTAWVDKPDKGQLPHGQI